MKITVIKDTDNRIDIKKIKKILEYSIKNRKLKNKNINLIFTDNQQIKAINKKFRGKNRVTDIISYCIEDMDFHIKDIGNDFGEVVISYPQAKSQAREMGCSIIDRIIILSVHGIVHILGYDHGKSLSSAKKMADKEKYILDNIKKITL